MKKLLIMIVIFTSCETTIKREKAGQKINGTEIEILEIDSCEYIFCPYGNSGWASHKGNCKFCKERLISKN